MGVFNLFKNMKKKDDQDKPSSRFIDDEWVEVSASSKEEAIERACTALNANESHLEIKFLSKDGKKIRARKATQEQKAAPKEQKPREERSRREEKPPRREKKPPMRSAKPMHDEKTDETAMNDDRYDDRYEEEPRQENFREQEPEEEEIEEETDLGRKAKEILVQIVQAIEANSTVELYETTKTIRLEIESKESGLFIGKFGQTLDAIQHLLKKMLELKHEDGKHLVVDAENYRVRREESIESKARKLAKKARQERRPVSIEPMNAMDRRIVHMALKGEPGIETRSIGEGASRRVLIVPKRAGGARGPSSRNAGGRGESRGDGRNDNRARGGRGRSAPRDGNINQPLPGNPRLSDSYDVPAHSKSEVFGDNPEEYFEHMTTDEEK